MDKARKWTDKQLEKMESEIEKIYKKANKDITEKWNSYMKSEQKRLDALKAEAERTGDMYEYQRVLRNFTLQNQKYQSMVNQTTEKIANANKIAVDYLNEKTPSIYSTNYNQVIGEVNGMKANINFDMVDESTVKKLIKNGSIDLLPKKVDISKDMKWNTKKINSQVMQGILQGESIGDISKRLQNVTDMNEKSAIRNARTMTTNAECMGRMDSYHELQDAGVVLKKVWIATADERTRAWHTDLDGVEMDIDEPFVAILADGTEDDIMYPGDPDADPANVYNCRCSLETRIISIDDVGIDEEDIIEDDTSEVVNGKDISETWERRPDQFDFAIEDVINAQGFDGLPRVVDADEFEKILSESNIIMQRGYRADNYEILDSYRDALYNGKWYVDCSTGGSAYGKGMYTAFNKGVKLDEITAEFAERYAKGYSNQVGYVETMTLNPNAKIINYSDAVKLAEKIQDEYGYGSPKREALERKILKESIDKLDDIDKTTKQYVYDRYFKSFEIKETDIDTIEWYKGLSEEKRNKVDEYVKNKIVPIDRKIDDIVESYRRIDPGTAAALNGYDALVNNPEKGELVVLNRTKLFIKKVKK